MGEQRVWVLQRRLTELGDNLRAEWSIYVKFYTAFRTFSLAALGWVSTGGANAPYVRMVAWAFLAQTVMTAITSLLMSLHSRRVRVRQQRLETMLLELEHTTVPNAPLPIPLRMTLGRRSQLRGDDDHGVDLVVCRAARCVNAPQVAGGAYVPNDQKFPSGSRHAKSCEP